MSNTRYIVASIITIIVVLVAIYLIIIEQPRLLIEDNSSYSNSAGSRNNNISSDIGYGEYSDNISFEDTGGKIIGLDEFKNTIRQRGIDIYLPTWLPNGYKLSAVWASNESPISEQDFFIVVYSKDGSTSPRCGGNRIGIEIYIGAVDTDPIASYGANASSIIKEGGMEAVILSNSYCGWNVRPQVAAYVKIGDVLYAIMGDISVSEMESLVRSMKPIT